LIRYIANNPIYRTI